MERSGHLFVVRADITKLRCDAWLCPTDREFRISDSFCGAVVRAGASVSGELIEGLDWNGGRALPLTAKRLDGGTQAEPAVVLADVGRWAPSDDEKEEMVADLVQAVKAFIHVAVDACALGAGGEDPRPPMLALPLVGTGEGGFDKVKGEVVKQLLRELQSLATERAVDLVLCVPDPVAYSAVQRARKSSYPSIGADESLAQALADQARRGGLVLFIGAGASRDADLPGWSDLLERLGAAADVTDPRDAATLVEHDLGGREALVGTLRSLLGTSSRFGLTQALLASVGVSEAITTNFDPLFELASTPPGQTPDEAISVLPYGLVQEGRPWLLKLHGSIERSGPEAADDLVITRADYSRLRRERGALFGIVQAVLVTKHLLFVGYSLSDEDFHQLVDEIRLAVGPALEDGQEGRRLGTVLAVEHSPLEPIWRDILDIQVLGDAAADNSRRLLILLDRLAHLAAPHHRYLLDPAFVALRSDAEDRLAERLMAVQDLVNELGEDPAAKAVDEMLRHFGAQAAAADADIRRPT